MKKAVVTFELDEGTGYCQTNVDKDDGLRGIDLLSAIGAFYAKIVIESGYPIACLSGLIGYIADKTDKGRRELLNEIEERMEEVNG